MYKQILTSFSALLLVLTGMSQNIPESGSLEFHFKYNSPAQNTVLSLEYMQNRANMGLLMSGISSNKNSILEGRKYISIVPCIQRGKMFNPDEINRASIQASVIRATLKVNAGIPHECIAFAIDTTQNVSNVVMVNIFEGPLPQGKESGTIQYILNGKTDAIFTKYSNGVPYGNIWMIQARSRNTTLK